MASLPLLGEESAGANGNIDAHILLDEQPDFAQVIASDPEGVIAYIEQKGVQNLGTFKVQVRTSRINLHAFTRRILPCNQLQAATQALGCTTDQCCCTDTHSSTCKALASDAVKKLPSAEDCNKVTSCQRSRHPCRLLTHGYLLTFTL